MRIKTLTAPHMEDALRIIRQQLGPDALILDTRKVKGADGQMTLQITAAVKEEAPLTTAVETTGTMPKAPRQSAIPTFDSILADHGLTPTIIEKITAALPGLQNAGFSQPDALEMLLSKMASLKSPTEILPAGKAHLFIGPQGAGKTTLIAKLAIHTRKQGRTVGMLSLDDQKIAGFEPLAIAAETLGDTAHLLTSAADLKSAAAKMGPRHLLLIDTPGLNPFQPQSLNQIQQRLKELAIPVTTHLVIPTPLNAPDMSALPIACHRFNLASIIFTKLDATTRYGALFTTAVESGLPIGIATHSAEMTTPPLTLTAKWLAEALTQLPHQPWEFPQ